MIMNPLRHLPGSAVAVFALTASALADPVTTPTAIEPA